VRSFKIIDVKVAPIIVSVDLNLLMYTLDFLFWLLEAAGKIFFSVQFFFSRARGFRTQDQKKVNFPRWV
jgi:hypothetical protein